MHGPRAADIAVSPTGALLAAACASTVRLSRLGVGADGSHRIVHTSFGADDRVPRHFLHTSYTLRTHFLHTSLGADDRVLDEKSSVTSLSFSADGGSLLVNLARSHEIARDHSRSHEITGSLLVNLASDEVHAWDIHDHRACRVVHKYRGRKYNRYTIRAAFGGVNDAFVASGSEDSQVYIWHRHSAALLEVLPGHSGTVNAVAWSPTDPHMFASCSDDHTVRVWGVPDSAGGAQLSLTALLDAAESSEARDLA